MELMDTRLYSPTHPQLTSPIPNVQTEKEPVCVYVCVRERERKRDWRYVGLGLLCWEVCA